MIKNFIYLDAPKMYSLSSQILEGVTDYIINEKGIDSEDSESQKGPIASGKILADVLRTSNKSIERRLLNDFSYTLFENALLERGQILDISAPFLSLDDLKGRIVGCSFIRVRAKAIFNDINKVNEMLESFNSFGQALVHVTSYAEMEKLRAEIASMKQAVGGDREKKARLEAEEKRLTNTARIARERGLYQDPKFSESMLMLTKYGFSDQFEIHQFGNELAFTSCLKREYLREDENLLVKKYSRKTEKEIVVLGMVAQAFSPAELNLDARDDGNLKTALLNVVEHLTSVESSISGKSANEVVIDPIAAYFEI